MQVCFVALPFQNIENPVLALSLLKSCLAEQNISSQIIYANLDYATRIGLKAYCAIANGGVCREAIVGEYVFAEAAFGEDNAEYLHFIRAELEPHIGAQRFAQLEECIATAKQHADAFLDHAVAQVLATEPQIVAVSSTTQQNCVCLAFLRKLKAAAPHIITVMGGPNCERIMGRTLAANFPQLDYVISGEADSFWAAFCAKLLREQRLFPEYPYVFTRNGAHDAQAAGFTQDLDSMPHPDYDDYFAALENFPLKQYVNPGLLIETSRGCWWGDKHPCTFCGMNGGARTYRQKSPARAIAEFAALSEKYQLNRFFAVDCILSQQYWKTVLPKLRELKLKLMYEIKTNATAEQLAALKEAGITWVQPGIESLQDDLLRLMNKGNRGIKHVWLLRQLTELGIRCCWLILCAFPGDENSWYAEQLATMQLLTHLQPPDATFRLRYDRFSVYEQHEAEYGLQLEASPAYFYIYPKRYHPALRDFAYFFTDLNKPQPLYGQGFTEEEHLASYRFIESWRQHFYTSMKDRLVAQEKNDILEVMDFRSCAVHAFHDLAGCEKDVALLARDVISRKKLQETLAGTYTEQQVNTAVQKLVEQKLLLEMHGELLFLPLFHEHHFDSAEIPPLGNISPQAFIETHIKSQNEVQHE